MSKEKVYIVISHKHSLKKGTKDNWEVAESIEFVSHLRNRHYTTSSIIADYLNKKLITGKRFGMTEYDMFDAYIRKKYDKQMAQLDAAYGKEQVVEEVTEEVVEERMVTDQFGSTRPATVFDAQ